MNKMRVFSALVLGVLAGASTASAGSLKTTYDGNFTTSVKTDNNSTAFFDLTLHSAATITSLEMATKGGSGNAFTLEVFVTAAGGTYVGNANNAGAWTQVATGSGNTSSLPAPVDITDFTLPAGTYGLAIHIAGPSINNDVGFGGRSGVSLVYQNNDMTVSCGAYTNVDGLFNDNAPATGWVWSGELFYSLVGTGTGACCKNDGSCAVLTAANCAAQSGHFQGNATACGAAVCPVYGACCLPGGTCEMYVSQAACVSQIGIWNGTGVTCGSVNCNYAPPNDDCANAAVLNSLPHNFNVDIRLAKADEAPGSCTSSLIPGAFGVWYLYTPPSNGYLNFTETGPNETLAAIWSVNGAANPGSDCSSFTAENGACVSGGNYETFSRFVEAGKAYYIQVSTLSATGLLSTTPMIPANPTLSGSFSFTPEASDVVNTLYHGNDAEQSGSTVYFDLTVSSAVTITQIGANVDNSLVLTADVYITDPGQSYIGNTDNPNAWTIVATGLNIAAGENSVTLFDTNDFTLNAGTYGVAIRIAGGASNAATVIYTVGDGANKTYATDELAFIAGAVRKTTAPFTGGTLETNRVFNGTLFYTPVSVGTGACCLPNGSCSVLTPGDCAAQSGGFQGVDVTCGPTACPVAPPNDLCVNAQPLASLPANISFSNYGATADIGPGPCNTNTSDNYGAWYVYTAAADGVLHFSETGAPDVNCGVWEVSGAINPASNCGSFTPANGTCFEDESWMAPVVAGRSYYILIAAAKHQGLISGTFSFTSLIPNDNCGGAIEIPNSPLGTTYPIDDPLANDDNGYVSVCSTIYKYGVWFKYTPTQSNRVLYGVTSNSVLFRAATVWETDSAGATCPAPGSTAAFCQIGNPTLQLDVKVGKTYYMLIARSGSTPPTPATITFAVFPGPSNNICSGATTVTLGRTTYNNLGAGADLLGGTSCLAPFPYANSGIWFRYDALSNGTLDITEYAASRQVAMNVWAMNTAGATCPTSYTGATCYGYDQNDQFHVPVQANKTYYILVSSLIGTTAPSVPLDIGFALSAPPCTADFNGVNGVTVQDIFDFLTAWLAGSPSADFNHVNGVTVQDIFDFLTAWLAGC